MASYTSHKESLFFSHILPGHVQTHSHSSGSDHYIKEADLSESVTGHWELQSNHTAEELITTLIGANRSNFSCCSKLPSYMVTLDYTLQ